jgi:1,4-dihydroxy-2-naphthoate octaprenyltransferase
MDWSFTSESNVTPSTHLAVLYEMSRPSQLLIMGSLYTLGAAAGHGFGQEVPVATLALGGVLLVLAGASINYINEYADFESDRRTERTSFSGGSGALVDRDLGPELGLQAAIAVLAACTGFTAVTVLTGLLSPVAATLLALFLLLGWEYSVWPLALAWRGLGELDNAIAGGLVLPLYGYAVVTGDASLDLVAAFLPTTAFLFLTLLATTWPDRQADARAGKATLATRLGPSFLRLLYLVWLAVAALLVVGLPLSAYPLLVRAGAACSLVAFGYGFARYTRQHSPTPTVLAMVGGVCLQAVGWLVV